MAINPVIIKVPWTKQPPIDVTPISFGFIGHKRFTHIWYFNQREVLRDFVGGLFASTAIGSVAALSWQNSGGERAIYCDTASTANAIVLHSVNDSGGFTVRFMIPSLDARHGVVRFRGGGKTNLSVETDGSLVWANNVNTTYLSSAAGAIKAGQWHTVTFDHTSTSGNDEGRVWLDGVRIGSFSDQDISISSGTTYLFRNSQGSGLKGYISYYVEHASTPIDNDHVVDNDVANLHANPWQIFKPQKQFALAPVSEDVRFATVKKVRTEKPPIGTRLDTTNPLTKALSAFVIPNGIELVDVMSGVRSGLTAGLASNLGLHNSGVPNLGQGILFKVTASDSPEFTFLIPSITRGNYSCIAIGMEVSSGGGDGADCLPFQIAENGNEASRYIKVGHNSHSTASRRYLATARKFGAPTAAGGPSGAMPAAAWEYDIPGIGIGNFDAVTDIHRSLSPNGYFHDRPTTADFSVGVIDKVLISNTIAATSSCVFYFGAYWNRKLSDGEMTSFKENPWQIFEPELIHVPFNEDLPEIAVIGKEWKL